MKKSNWQPTEWSDASGMRRLIAYGKQGDDSWPSAADQRKVKDGGIVEVDPPFTGTVSELSSLPDTKQRWDNNPSSYGVEIHAEPGPALRSLEDRQKQ